MQYSLDEITLLPSAIPTDIDSRSKVNPFDSDGNLPIFVAPMTSVINSDNFQTFKDYKVIPILPRNCNSIGHEGKAFSLNEVVTLAAHHLFCNEDSILIDIANGHQKRLYQVVKMLKAEWPDITIMIGNIANPSIYKDCCEAGVDFVRVGIGGGSVCSTSVQCGIHASHHYMIQEIKKMDCYYKPNRTKLIADGGINTLDRAIKCLGLGYDYVMMGKCFAQCEEACGETKQIDNKSYRKYYGMASEQGQIDISGGCTKNPEGIETWVEIDNTLEAFTKKFEAALRSSMSYTGAHNLREFRNSQWDIQSINEFKAYYK